MVNPRQGECRVPASAVALLHIFRQAKQEVRNRMAAGAAGVAGKLTSKGELARQTGIARIKIVHDVAIGLESEVEHMFPVRPGQGIFKLQRGVMERLDQVVISNHSGQCSRAAESNGGQERIAHPGDTKG